MSQQPGRISLRSSESFNVVYGNLNNQKLMQGKRIYRICNHGPGTVAIRVDNDNTSDVTLNAGHSCDAEGLRITVAASATDPAAITYEFVA